jgi:hypothetical protein
VASRVVLSPMELVTLVSGKDCEAVTGEMSKDSITQFTLSHYLLLAASDVAARFIFM